MQQRADRCNCLSYWAHVRTQKHAIASKGGHASSGSFQPGSERAREAGRKGGRARGSGGGGGDDAEEDEDDTQDNRTQDNRTE